MSDCRWSYLISCFESHCCIAARVQWHRARADMERWQEELAFVAQEFRRAIQGFNKMETVWTALAHEHAEDPGKKAYALKVANMYDQMGKDTHRDGHGSG